MLCRCDFLIEKDVCIDEEPRATCKTERFPACWLLPSLNDAGVDLLEGWWWDSCLSLTSDNMAGRVDFIFPRDKHTHICTREGLYGQDEWWQTPGIGRASAYLVKMLLNVGVEKCTCGKWKGHKGTPSLQGPAPL